jgi:hypothetical protein
MKEALDKLAAVRPDNTAGSRASNRFAFQRDWTLCRLLDLHQRGAQYVIVCDYHDDVLVIDASSELRQVHFYQVKTDRSKRWKLKKLLDRPKQKTGHGPSILGKLYGHRITFDSLVISTTLVTNLPLDVTLRAPPGADARDGFCVTDLFPADISLISKAIVAELSLASAPVLDASLAFETASMTIVGHDTYAKGRLAEFLADRDPEGAHPVVALYRTVADEIQRRTNDESECLLGADLLRVKGVARDDFENIVVKCLAAARGRTLEQVADKVQAGLIASGKGTTFVRTVTRAVKKFGVERLDSNRLDLRHLSQAARSFFDDPSEPDRNLPDAIEACANRLAASDHGKSLDREYLRGLAAWEFIEDEGNISPTHEKHEDETA